MAGTLTARAEIRQDSGREGDILASKRQRQVLYLVPDTSNTEQQGVGEGSTEYPRSRDVLAEPLGIEYSTMPGTLLARIWPYLLPATLRRAQCAGRRGENTSVGFGLRVPRFGGKTSTPGHRGTWALDYPLPVRPTEFLIP